jgi:UDP-N-acetylglucosamine 2-epimerase
MSASFFEELAMQPPDYNLGVGSASQALQTGEIMKRLEPVLKEESPELAIVYGDTNSTLAAALTASKLHIPVAHVEAGLRSFNREMPEEINRVVADHVATFLFCPTTTAVQNLEKEGITHNVFNTGDVMYDATLQFSQRAEEKSSILRDLGLEKKEYILATVHRAENTDNRQRLFNIFSALKDLTREIAVVVPLHPRTRKMLLHFVLGDLLDSIKILEPVGFLDMVSLESNARLIATDSGGVQKEAYFHQVPCVTLRDETEWVETIIAHWNVLAKIDSVDEIIKAVRTSLALPCRRDTINEYGDGRASVRIVDVLTSFLLT